MSDPSVRRLQSKIDKQREEIARLTRQVQTLRKENAKLLADLKWMRGDVPMHSHRPRRNPSTVKSRLAASQSARARSKDGIKLTLPKPPWEMGRNG